MKALIIISIVVFAILLAACSSKTASKEKVDEFAKCLTASGTKMYGAFWCPHCARTKARFGPSFKYIDYVECDPRGDKEQSELCISKGIDKYDTWEFANGSRIVSEPTFEQLAKMSGCTAPG